MYPDHDLKKNQDKKYTDETIKADINMFAFSISPSFEIEEYLLKSGFQNIAGIDEAGRGALAGPLAVGMVLYSRSIIADVSQLPGINDSKKLTPARREKAEKLILEKSAAAHTVLISNHQIDRIDNINRATEVAVKKLLTLSAIKPDIIIMDGNFNFSIGVPFIPVLKGDTKSLSIASASIIAKVTRDRVLTQMDPVYPGYSFARHKGYGTRVHIQAIQEIGYCPVHRKSYEPVRSMVGNFPEKR